MLSDSSKDSTLSPISKLDCNTEPEKPEDSTSNEHANHEMWEDISLQSPQRQETQLKDTPNSLPRERYLSIFRNGKLIQGKICQRFEKFSHSKVAC
jgi:hypothetical protein